MLLNVNTHARWLRTSRETITHFRMTRSTTVRTMSVLAITCILVAACVGTRPIMLGAAANAGPVTCDTNCTTAWERAQLWIAKHARWKIQTATDVLIQTYNPPEQDASYGLIATKEPVGGGRYTIRLALRCANFIRCNPSQADVASAFNHYVATGEDVLLTAKYGSAIQ